MDVEVLQISEIEEGGGMERRRGGVIECDSSGLAGLVGPRDSQRVYAPSFAQPYKAPLGARVVGGGTSPFLDSSAALLPYGIAPRCWGSQGNRITERSIVSSHRTTRAEEDTPVMSVDTAT